MEICKSGASLFEQHHTVGYLEKTDDRTNVTRILRLESMGRVPYLRHYSS